MFFGMVEPVTDSSPNTYFTPSTASISPIIAETFFSGRSVSSNNMWVDATSNVSSSLCWAMR